MTFSSAVMCDHRLKLWNTIATSARMRWSCFGSQARSMPSLAIVSASVSPATSMDPAWGRSSRLMQRSSVLLPEPDDPITLITSPVRASSEMPRSTACSP